jgi:hypothetical protein
MPRPAVSPGYIGYRFLGFLVGQQPNELIVPHLIVRHAGFGKQPAKVREVFAMNEVIHISIRARDHPGEPLTACPVEERCYWPGDDRANMDAGGFETMSCIAHVARNKCPK